MLSFLTILKEHAELKKLQFDHKASVGILANVTVNQFDEILSFFMRKSFIQPEVELGNYDNILQDANQFLDKTVVIVFWELANFSDNISYLIEDYSEEEFSSFVESKFREIQLLFEILKNNKLVIFNLFSDTPFNNSLLSNRKLNLLSRELNHRLLDSRPENVRLVNCENIYAELSIEKSIDYRMFSNAKQLHTSTFFIRYAEAIQPLIGSVIGRNKKAIIFDCDNTLWKGILGEDGSSGINMSSEDKVGMVFSLVQKWAVRLAKKGVIIGICSKNNESDVDEILKNHPNMILRDEHIAIKRINWENKAQNLQSIASELNIGIDSIVFIDDSDFEINLVKDKLPLVHTVQVPNNIYEYLAVLRDTEGFFGIKEKLTQDDLNKATYYKDQQQRNTFQKSFDNIEDYLRSLKINISLSINNENHIQRISQLTLKTNQFNLTTRRYEENEIRSLMNDENFQLITVSVSDSFGDNGITGVIILSKHKNLARIDSFLQSCRVIGRKIEYRIFDEIVRILYDDNIRLVEASYIPTSKNSQVSDFYNKLGFELISEKDNIKCYQLNLEKYQESKINYIDVTYGK
jgi:FkbH-like protein